jgi:anti-sigma factor RsiW
LGVVNVTCRELADFIDDYRNGALDADVRACFERHLTRCPNCVRYLAAYEKTIALGRRAFAAEEQGEQPTAASGAPEDLIRAILAARPRAHPDPS